MDFITDDRAQALQVGAVLLFGILIVLLSFWQAFVIPNQNEEVEFNHNSRVQEQLTELRSNIVSMPDSTAPRSASVELGVRYPSRLLFANPAPSSGVLETRGTVDQSVNVTIRNASASDRESPGVDAFWNGSNQTFNTGSIEYQPDYSILQDAPTTVYEHTVLYNKFERLQNNVSLTGQSIVDGERLTMITLTGELEEGTTDSVSVDVRPVSTRTRTVTLERDGGPITLKLPTQLAKSQWTNLLADEPARVANNSTNGTVAIELTRDSYQLTMARVGVGSQTRDLDPAYMAVVEGPGADENTTLERGETTRFTVEVRDSHNGPVTGVSVDASAMNGSFQDDQITTNGEGRATFVYTAPSGFDQTANITFNATNENAFITGGSAGVNITAVETESREEAPGEPSFDVQWDTDNFGPEFDCSGDECTISSTEDGEMVVNVTGAESGNLDFAVENTDAATLNTTSRDFSGDGPSVQFQTETMNFDPGESKTTKVFVLGGGDSDTVTINVRNPVPDSDLSRYVPEGYDNAPGQNLWPDKYGNSSLDLTVNGGGGNIDYESNWFSGAPGVEVDGSQAYFEAKNPFKSFDEATIFVVYDRQSGNHIYAAQDVNGMLIQGQITFRGKNDDAKLQDSDSNQVEPTFDNFGNNPIVATLRVESDGAVQTWINGTQKANISASSSSLSSPPTFEDLTLALGNAVPGSFGSSGVFGEVLSVDKALSDQERKYQECRLAEEYNIDNAAANSC